MLILTLSLVSGFKSFNNSLWDSAKRFLISEVISSLRDALRLSRKLFSTLGDFGLDGPTTLESCSTRLEFSTSAGEMKPSLTSSSALSWAFFLFWLLVVDIVVKKNILFLWRIEFSFKVFNKVELDEIEIYKLGATGYRKNQKTESLNQ